MYYAHFGLNEPPFKITPNTEVFFTGANRGAVLDAITYAVLNGEGIIKVVGEVGSGKTMLCRMLQALLPEKIENIYLANPSVAPEDILHAIAFELQLKLPRNADRLKVMQILQKHLLSRHASGRQVVIFIEEAQGMPIATLEEIRLLSNLETSHDKLLQIVLFGQPELDDNLNETSIRQLRERITHSFNLSPLQPSEISDYLIFRLRAAGYFGPQLFTPGAIKKISNAAQGLVRRVNILADKAMLAAFAENGYQVKSKHVRAAILDSEFGVEKVRTQAKRNRFLMWLGILIIGLAVAYLASIWYQKNGLTVNWQPAKVEPAKVEPAKVEPAKVEPAKVEPAKVESAEVESAEVESAEVESAEVESAEVESAEVESAEVESAEVESAEVESAEVESAEVESAEVESAEVESAEVIDKVLPEAQIKEEVVTTSRANEDVLTRRLNATSVWLANTSPSTVTIQLMGASDSIQLRRDLDLLIQEIETDELYVYQTKVSGRSYMNVLYGSFANRFDAKQALRQLSARIQKNKPQLRTVAGVLQEIKQLP